MRYVTILFFVFVHTFIFSQGSLFIIGGGDRPEGMMKRMILEARLGPNDHIAILTMSGANPDTSFYYIVQDLAPYTSNTIAHLPFKKSDSSNLSWLDSLRKAKLIFVTGGVQTRFMNVVLGTPIYNALHEAYHRGSMIAGTSAGAAIMCEVMITGDQIRQDTMYEGSFDRIHAGNVETKQGMGFLKNAIIDQHFVVRSRYNRLLTMLYHHPDKKGIGIDEATAVFVKNNLAEVIGESQVVVFSKPKKVRTYKGKVEIASLTLHVYLEGQRFKL